MYDSVCKNGCVCLKEGVFVYESVRVCVCVCMREGVNKSKGVLYMCE